MHKSFAGLLVDLVLTSFLHKKRETVAWVMTRRPFNSGKTGQHLYVARFCGAENPTVDAESLQLGA